MNPDEKAVYLTFDDGPIPEVTPWVLDLLDQYEIKATFFMVGDNVRKYPDIFRMNTDTGSVTTPSITSVDSSTLLMIIWKIRIVRIKR